MESMERVESKTENQTIIADKYIIEENIGNIGKGGYGTVYKVKEKNGTTYFAAKVIDNDEENEEDFKRECQMLNLTQGPFVIKLIEFGNGSYIVKGKSQPNKNYIIMEYAEKNTLYDYIRFPEKGFGEKYGKFIFREILRGVAACHEKGICHNDLKLANILLDKNFMPKICDFGLSHFIKGEDGNLIQIFCGTKDYASPQLLNGKPFDGSKNDVFSLGVILIKLVGGDKNPFKYDKKKRDEIYNLIAKKHNALFWILASKKFPKFSEDFKKLFISMVSEDEKERPTVREILDNSPWLEEIRNMSKEELEKLETEIYTEFAEREIKVKEGKIGIFTAKNKQEEKDINCNRGVENKYFSGSINLKYEKTGLNMRYYIKIEGELNLNDFLNNFINEINKNNRCKVNDINTKKYKFNLEFEKEQEKNEELPKEIEEQLKEFEKIEANKEVSQNDEEESETEEIETIIQIKLLKSDNCYIVRFRKKLGYLSDFYNNLDIVKKVIEKVI